MKELWDRFLEIAYEMARKIVDNFEASRFILQHSSVLVALQVEEVLARLGLKVNDERVIDAFRALFFEKGSEGKVVMNYKDARIELKKGLSTSGGVKIGKYMPPIRWVYVYLPVVYYDQARKKLIAEE